MKLPNVRGWLVLEIVGLAAMRSIYIVAWWMVGGALVALFYILGWQATVLIMVLLLVGLVPLDLVEQDAPQHLTPENRARLLDYMRSVRAKLRHDK